MNCPFLRETGVKYCHAAPVRKLIPLAQAGRAEEKCSSGAYRECPVYRASGAAGDGMACPHLAESLMQCCGAAPGSRLVPYSESVLSRCGNGAFRYCDVYLAMAHPDLDAEMVEGTPVPGWLRYSANHMWLDVGEDGQCHAGIDAFLSRTLGPVERVSYVWMKGEHRAAAIVTAGGLDLEIVFPNPLRIGKCNVYLRANPARLTSDPYTAGWLFEGTAVAGTTDRLREGAAAREWMEREHRRMNQFLQEQDGGLPADGGTFAPGVIAQLAREQSAALFHEFFSPWRGGSRDASGRGDL